MRKKTDRLPISASAKANISATAKLAYTRKRVTSEIIPPDVTRARAVAWLDLISPLTEWVGLKGDDLRHRREVIRLQREAALAEISRKCAERREPTAKLTSIPNKFLVPFLEQASLEEKDSPLVDLWANLLISATEDFDPRHTHFVGVISRISHRQAAIFTDLFRAGDDLRTLERARDNVAAFYEYHAMQDTIERAVMEEQPKTDDDFDDMIIRLMDQTGLSIVHAAFENIHTEHYFDVRFPYMSYRDDQEADYSILESVGIVRRVNIGFINVDQWSVLLSFYHITALGFYFAVACKMLPPHTSKPRGARRPPQTKS